MQQREFIIDSKTYVRVAKPRAKKLFNTGKPLYLLPCMASPHSPWNQFALVDNMQARTFDQQVNAFEYYNCNSQMGKFAAYYVEKKDLKPD